MEMKREHNKVYYPLSADLIRSALILRTVAYHKVRWTAHGV